MNIPVSLSRTAAGAVCKVLAAADRVAHVRRLGVQGRDPRRILCVCLSHLGDLVLLTPLFANLRNAYPDAHIAVVCKSAVADIPRNHPAVDEVITHEARWILRPTSPRAGLVETMKLIRKLRARLYDLLVVCYDHPMDRILGLCTGIPAQVSLLDAAKSGEGRTPSPGAARHPLPQRGDGKGLLERDPARHRVEHAFDLLRMLEVPIVDSAPSIGIPAADVAWADQWLIERGLNGKTILGVHPGAGGPEKRWPSNRFARVASELASRFDFKVVVTGSQVDADAVQDFMRNVACDVAQAPLTLAVGRLCALIQQFAILLCNDCGPMHIAAALRVPAIAVFGPSSPQLWGPCPANPCHVVVAARDANVESVTPEEVLAAINCSPLLLWLREKATATI